MKASTNPETIASIRSKLDPKMVGWYIVPREFRCLTYPLLDDFLTIIICRLRTTVLKVHLIRVTKQTPKRDPK